MAGHPNAAGGNAAEVLCNGIRVGGVQWTSLIDYPGRIAATLFLQGCNFRCPFCHNPELVDPQRFAPERALEDVLGRLRVRVGFLDAVVVSGGEPTLHPGLPALAGDLKSLGFLIKLDTNGSRPQVLRRLLEHRLVDFVAMDVKAPLDEYPRLTGVACDVAAIGESIDLILADAPDYEFRTTAAPTLEREDILRIAARLRGARRYVLQAFRVPETGLLDPTWRTRAALPIGALERLWNEVRSLVDGGGVRG
jgi:pyruvate formate lyase activating enzyme